MNQNTITRLWFLSQGCKQVPLEHAKNIVRWGHPDGYFLKPNGQKAKDNLSPSQQKPHNHSHAAPFLRECAKTCHVLMALAFYGEREIFKDKNGKPYVGICHHLIPNLLDYRPANLLCWLTREEHAKADARQRTLKTIVPDGNLVGFDYAILRELQDPRSMSDADFNDRMEYLRVLRDCGFDPRIFTAAQLHEFFAQPFDEFSKVMYHHKNDE